MIIEKNEILLKPRWFDIDLVGSNLAVSDDRAKKLLDITIDVTVGKVALSL